MWGPAFPLISMKRFLFLFLLLLTLTASATENADTIKLPAGTIEGTLPNGLHYLILPNAYPAGRAEFRLIWQVGAVQQDDSQGGAAHFLEHMAFGGSRNFPNRGAVGYLESMGMRYGIDINAFTGHDRTIYLFATPTTPELKASGFERPLTIIRDWMDGLTINPSRIETEKGIILEELRTTQQPDPFYNLKIGQNRFSARMPLGTADEVSRMTAKTLKEYYRRWYRPQMATIAVVGDIEPEAVEREIRRKFSSVKKGSVEGFRRYPLTYSPNRQIMLDVDSLTTNDEIEIIIPHPGLTVRTIGDARKRELQRIVVNALSRRMQTLGIAADVTDAWYLGNTNHLVFSARERKGESIDTCIGRMANELAAAVKFGFDDNEIRYQVDNRARVLSKMSNRENTSTGWCDDFADYVISGDRHITDSLQTLRLIEAVKTISPSEAHNQLLDWMAYADSTILIAARTAPSRVDDRRLDDVLAWWNGGLAASPNMYVFTEPVEQTWEPVETPAVLAAIRPYDESLIAGEKYLPGIGVHQYVLDNGIRLLVKHTVDDSHTTLMGCVSPGGYASLSPEKLPLLGSTASYIDMGGIAKVPHGLGDYMYQNNMALSTVLENDWHGLIGAFDTDRANEYFNLLYEKITDPQLLREDFEEIRQSMLEDSGEESTLSKMLSRDPSRQLMIAMDRLMGRTLDYNVTREDIETMSIDSMAAFFTELYGRTDRTTYILCGDFEPDTMARRFASVFGRIPSDMAAEYSATSPLDLPAGRVNMRFDSENPGETAFDYLYFGEYEPGLRNSLVLKIMCNLMRNHVIADLREQKALVYSPFVDIQYEGRPRGYYVFDVNSSTGNANMGRVHSALRDVIRDLQTNPVSDTELQGIKNSCIVARREALSPFATATWRTILTGLIKNGETLEDFDRYDEIINTITAEEIRDAFNRYIDPDQYALLYISTKDFNPAK